MHYILLFFCFKQKTAYEVRISDWSSDVCSSDLGQPCHSSRPAEGCNAVTGAVEVVRRLTHDIKLEGSHPQLGRTTLTVNGLRSFPESTHTLQEIGRASCRESECPYV